MKIDGLGVMD